MRHISELLKGWYEDMERIQATWNGKESGSKEERAMVAMEAQQLIEKLAQRFEDLNYELRP